MSDTPRTDGLEYDTGLRTIEECATGEDGVPDMVVPAEFARIIERELAAERAAREKAELERNEWRMDFGVLCRTVVSNTGASAIETAHKLRANVARLREALERLLAAEDSGMGVIGWEDAVGNARAALKDTDG